MGNFMNISKKIDESKLTIAENIIIIREKHQQVAEIMKEENIECWMIVVRETVSNPDPIQNLVISGELVWISAFIFSNKDNKFRKTAIVGNFDVPAQQRKGIWDEVIGYKKGISAILQPFLNQLNPKSIALNYSETDVVADGLSHGLFEVLKKMLPEFVDRFQSAEKIIQKLRGRKTSNEIAFINEACQITDKINHSISSQISIGMTETEIYDLFQQEMQKYGVSHAWLAEHCPMVDAGPDKVVGHTGPLSTQITKLHNTLHNDFGVKYHGYCSDIQRMWFFGTKDEIPEELIHAFETVKTAIKKASEFIHPGVRGFEVDEIARKYVTSQGYEEFGHALGHQVGTAAHDGGILLGPLWERYGEAPKGIIEIDNVFTLELEVKTAHYGIVSLEEMIQITQNGCKFFLTPQQEWWCITKNKG